MSVTFSSLPLVNHNRIGIVIPRVEGSALCFALSVGRRRRYVPRVAPYAGEVSLPPLLPLRRRTIRSPCLLPRPARASLCPLQCLSRSVRTRHSHCQRQPPL